MAFVETVVFSEGLYSDAFKRTQNMDTALTLTLQEQPGVTGGMWLGVVCDGTSDSQGKEASRLAVRSVCQDAAGILELLPKLREKLDALTDASQDLSGEDYVQEIERVLCQALFPILREMILNAHGQILKTKLDSATTITLVLICQGYVFSANLGDSPAFLLQRDSGSQCLPLYECHNRGGRLTSWIGSQIDLTETDIPVFSCALGEEALVVLGSDGALPASLDIELQRALINRDGFNDQCGYLLERAERIGSTDNFTYISARVGVCPA